MSVQRAEVHWARYLDGNRRVVLEADHARIVAEAGAAVFAFHPEWTVTGMCDPDCLACRRLTELITERSAGYEEGKADAEQAHAAALAEAVAAGEMRNYHEGFRAALAEMLVAVIGMDSVEHRNGRFLVAKQDVEAVLRSLVSDHGVWRYEEGQRAERDRIRTELLSLASERAGVAGRNTALTGFMRRYLIDLASVLDVVGGSDPAAVPHPATQDGEAGR